MVIYKIKKEIDSYMLHTGDTYVIMFLCSFCNLPLNPRSSDDCFQCLQSFFRP